jgi:hypothetical protein
MLKDVSNAMMDTQILELIVFRIKLIVFKWLMQLIVKLVLKDLIWPLEVVLPIMIPIVLFGKPILLLVKFTRKFLSLKIMSVLKNHKFPIVLSMTL